MESVVWAIIGFVLLIAEMVSGTFFIIFFGISALIVALLKILFLDNLATEILLFAVIGALSALILRKRLINTKQLNHGKERILEPDINQTFVSEQDIELNQEVVVMYQGTLWRANNIGPAKIIKNDRVRIIKTEGNKLLVEKDYLTKMMEDLDV